ncbi:MAG TPA: glutathione S-transferase family protein [Candidatus Latescibacteria bacterium]|jgi:putative glutathione S-transferase|nr:glutathione-dependent reductase [Gemmatimonadaceae bacterium]MDP6016802.1 glutathione S-transferase family protein [Candidatus Latescibacterota bacterium]HJP31378.1 glutathione S-transferase family protein [Candidatus Latescibacterota bacterium]
MDIKAEQQQGEFVRPEDTFREWIAAGEAAASAGAARYHLYVSLACPWAHRTIITRKLRGLEDVIPMTVVDPVRDDRGWRFGEGEGFEPDPNEGFRFLSEAYQLTDPAPNRRVTVPVLWDRTRRRIVNNSEDDICRMFNDVFPSPLQGAIDLFPQDLHAEATDLNGLIYEDVNNGVYRAGFAGTQAAYERCVMRLFRALDQLEERLSNTRYLLGNHLTESDLRLFCTLIRFDAVYYLHFKCNVRRIVDYPNLWGFTRDIYQLPGVADTVNLNHIKQHYYVTHPDINPTRIVPVGPELDFAGPHGRGDSITIAPVC